MLRSPLTRFAIAALVALPFGGAARAAPPPAPPPVPDALEEAPPVPERTFAQAGPGKREKGEKRGRGRLTPEERKKLEEEVGRKIDTYLTVELSTRLGLSDEKALKLAKLIQERRTQKQARRQAVRAEYQRLQELVDKKAGDAELRAQTQRTIEAAQRMDREQGLFDETARFLTAEEQARLVLAYPHVRHEMRRMLREARGGKGRGAFRAERGGRGGRGFQGLDSDF